MSFMGGSMATGPASGLRFATTRGRINGSNIQGVNYPSPFFDIAHTYLPVTVKQLFKWCRYYFLTNPLINATVFKLSEYPVTDIIIDHDDPEVKKRWTEYFQDHLRYRSFQVESGLDFHAYGNGYISLGYPFKKYLFCTSCSFRDEAPKIRANWIFTNFNFRLTCPRCGHIGDATPKDQYYKNASGIKTIRWNPEDVEVRYNDMTGDYTYFYDIPAIIRNDIVIGRKDVVDGIPQVFIQAMREQKGVIFSKDNFFHMRRPTLAGQDRGIGVPLLLPVLKDTFYLQIMKKAQEAILVEHIVPLRILFPQAGSGSSDPYTTINLIDWRDQVAQEIARWRTDCVTPDTLVETAEGLKRADEIVVGSQLRNHMGGLSTVEKTWRRSLRDGERAYQLVARGMHGDIPTVSEDHPFLVRRKRNNGNGHKLSDKASFVRAKDIHVGDYIGHPVPVFKPHGLTELDLGSFVSNAVTEKWLYIDHQEAEVPHAFEYLTLHGPVVDRQALLEERGWSRNQYKVAQLAHREGRTLRRLLRYIPLDEELCWVAGLYLAEGNTSSKQVLFALHKNETDFIARLDSFFAERFGAVGFTAERSENGIQRYYSSTVAAQFFHELCGGTATSKRINTLLLHAGEKKLAALLRGYLDGDGCYHEKDIAGSVDVTSASRQLAADCLDVLLSIGVLACLTSAAPAPYDIGGKKGVSHGYWKVAAHGADAKRLREWLGLPSCGTDREMAEYSRVGLFADGYLWRRIGEVREVEAAEVIGFQVDKTISVLLEDDTEAHGTFCLRVGACGNSNYIPILPIPLGNQTIGGDGRTLLLTQEIQAWSEQIMVGMGVPREFLMGGMSYAGTNVSMRMLENMFIGYLQRQRDLARFIMRQVASYLDWPMANIRFKPFKMADDLQRKAFEFQLNAAGKLSDTTLLASSDFSQEDENRIMIRETDTRLEATEKQQLAMATVQGKASVIMMKFQAKAQQELQIATAAPTAPGEPGAGNAAPVGATPGQATAQPIQPAQPSQQPVNGGAAPQDFLQQIGSQLSGGQRMLGAGGGQAPQQQNIDLPSLAMMQARTIATLPKQQQQQALTNLAFQSPELADLVRQYLAQMSGGAGDTGGTGGSTVGGVDTRPLPQQRPPRRAGGMV